MPHLQCNLFAAFHPRMLVKTNNGFDSLYVLIVPLFPCAHEDIIPGRVTTSAKNIRILWRRRCSR